MLCLTSMRTNSGRDSDTLVFGNEARGLIQRDAKTMHLAFRGLLTSRHYIAGDILAMTAGLSTMKSESPQSLYC